MKEEKSITLLRNNEIKDITIKNQQYLMNNEKNKYSNIIDIFDDILKVKIDNIKLK